MYKTLGFKWLHECFCPASAFVTSDRDEARNPQRFIHVTVGADCIWTTNNTQMNKLIFIAGLTNIIGCATRKTGSTSVLPPSWFTVSVISQFTEIVFFEFYRRHEVKRRVHSLSVVVKDQRFFWKLFACSAWHLCEVTDPNTIDLFDVELALQVVWCWRECLL